MSIEKLPSDFAFPLGYGLDSIRLDQPGLTKLEYFAVMAYCGMNATAWASDVSEKKLAELAVSGAVELMRALDAKLRADDRESLMQEDAVDD